MTVGRRGMGGGLIKRSSCWATSTMTTTQSPPKTCQPRSLSLTQRAELLLAASRIINTAGLCSLIQTVRWYIHINPDLSIYLKTKKFSSFCQVYQSPTHTHDFLGVAMGKGSSSENPICHLILRTREREAWMLDKRSVDWSDSATDERKETVNPALSLPCVSFVRYPTTSWWHGARGCCNNRWLSNVPNKRGTFWKNERVLKGQMIIKTDSPRTLLHPPATTRLTRKNGSNWNREGAMNVK